MCVKLIVAMCKKNGIGIDNKIPWRISEDMSYFSKKTSGNYVETNANDSIEKNKKNKKNKKNAVIMGRNTWESLPKKYKPLPNRFNIVLSRNVQKLLELNRQYADNSDIMCVSSVDGAMDLCYDQGEKGEKGEKNIKIEYASTSQFLSCNFNDIWIIGGSSVYEEFIHRDMTLNPNVCNSNVAISSYYITYIDSEYECDTYFPMLENMNKYHLTQFEKHECIDKNTPDASPLNVYYIVFKKIKYTDEKRIEEIFTSYRCNNGNNGNKNIERDLLFYIKKKKIGLSLSLCSNELEILFSMFCS
jgi:dihydrofolate reductase